MKYSIYLLICTVLLFGCSAPSVLVSTLPDANIIVNGKVVAGGSNNVIVPKNSNVHVEVKKVGFLTEVRDYANNQNTKLPKSDYINLIVDDSYASSVESNNSNKDFEIPTSKTEDNAWKTITSVVTSYIDVLETSDKASGYLKTTWIMNKFKNVTIRTRMIVKIGRTEPLTYKIKIVSQIANNEKNTKDDESYEDWDRILKKYEGILSEIQDRLK